MIREPAVAGAFYPGRADSLEATLDELIIAGDIIPNVVGAVSPHAGYVYSGRAAGALFASIDVPETVVVLGPNHRGIGDRYGVFDDGAWKTPLGSVRIDGDLASAILAAVPFLKADTSSHMYEHSIEVQVPFLQYRRPQVKIVPISIGEHDYTKLVKLGRGIAEAAHNTDARPLVLASSDMTHYESADDASRKDRKAIDRMLALDEEGLWHTVNRQQISMCGVAPAVAAITAAREFGAAEGRLISYMTSGDITGDYNEVVGYASLAFVREA
ncbi:MAG: AmmeMemoRadiSam system protein B [Planctomycetota bacterium]|jgi:AmmeMemoRadiSam system protein B